MKKHLTLSMDAGRIKELKKKAVDADLSLSEYLCKAGLVMGSIRQNMIEEIEKMFTYLVKRHVAEVDLGKWESFKRKGTE